MGSLGLMAFAAIVWMGLPRASTGLVLAIATLAWVSMSVMAWLARKTLWRNLRAEFFGKA